MDMGWPGGGYMAMPGGGATPIWPIIIAGWVAPGKSRPIIMPCCGHRMPRRSAGALLVAEGGGDVLKADAADAPNGKSGDVSREPRDPALQQ